MSDIHTGIHDVARIVTQRRQINGRWQRRIEVTDNDGARLTFVLYTPDCESTRIIEQPDEYVHVEDYEPEVKRGDKPFDSPPSAGERQS